MKSSHLLSLLYASIIGVCAIVSDARAQQTRPSEQPEAPSESVERETAAPAAQAEDTAAEALRRYRRFRQRHGDVILHVGEDSHLGREDSADAVISVFGSANAEGEVYEAVVAVFGNARASGPVGQDAVAVFGDTYVNGSVGENVVAVFGNLELGPDAVVDGDVVAVGGTITRDPQAVVHGDTQQIAFGGRWVRMDWLRTWIDRCLLYGRLLAFEPGLGWAWGIALGFLALYIAIALLFGSSVERCVETIEKQPGQTAIASLLSVLLTPVLMLLLIASVIGIAVVPLAGMILFCAGLFGKAVILAALGRRVTRFTGIGAFTHVAFAVLVGGIIALGLYVVPVLGLIVYKLLGILGLGAVVYTLLLLMRERRAEAMQPAVATAAAAGMPQVAPAETVPPIAAEPAPQAPPTQAAAETVAETALPRAGFWIRMGALLIDVILVSIIISILDPSGEITLLALAAYGAVMWKLKGTTIGGIVFDLKVVRRDGREISWDTAVVRALGCFLSLVVAGLGFLWIVFDPDRQAWHDKIAGTLVVRVPKQKP